MLNVGGIKQEESSPSLPYPCNMQARDGRGSSRLPCQLREGDQHGQQDSILIENRSCQKNFGMVMAEIKREEISLSPPSPHDS